MIAEEEADYVIAANGFKDEGNAAFKNGDMVTAIEAYTSAIDLIPDNEIYYSNRSAAYMKADSISKALKDGEKCISLNPNFIKGYNRLGSAQQALKRYDQAIDTYKKGLEIESNNDSLLKSLQLCYNEQEKEKEIRYAAAEIERRQEEEKIRIKEQSIKDKEIADAEIADAETGIDYDDNNDSIGNSNSNRNSNTATDDPLAGFFDEIATTLEEEKKKQKDSGSTSRGNVKGEYHEKYSKQDLGNGKDQYQRLTSINYEFKNLNPYYVLSLDIDATEEDIKQRYRKLSSKVHPDKLRNIENARDAFEHVNAAYRKLQDENTRKTLIKNITLVKEKANKDYDNYKNSNGNNEDKNDDDDNDDEERKAEVSKAIMKYFADIEMARRKAEKLQQSYVEREKNQAAFEREKVKAVNDHEKEWGKGDRQEKRINNWRSFTDTNKGSSSSGFGSSKCNSNNSDEPKAKKPRL